MIKYLKNDRFILFFISLTILLSATRVIRGIDFLYPLVLVPLSLLIFIGFNKVSTNIDHERAFHLFLLFSIWAAITSFWSINPFFTLIRAAYFLFIVSSVISINVLVQNKKELVFQSLFYINIIFVIFALISLVTGYPFDSWTAGNGKGFTGFAIHQNYLASLLFFSVPGVFYKLLMNIKENDLNNYSILTNKHFNNLFKKIINNKVSISYLILLIANWYLIFLSHSRAVILSLFVGMLVLIFLNVKNKIKAILVALSFCLIIILLVFNSLFEPIETYLKKGSDTYSATRGMLWESSLEAAKYAGFWGNGFGISDPKIETEFMYRSIGGNVRRETGNSILGLIDEVGIIGLVLYLIPIGYRLKKIIQGMKRRKSSKVEQNKYLKNSIIFTFILAYLLHAQFEGWLLGVSSYHQFIFLLIINID